MAVHVDEWEHLAVDDPELPAVIHWTSPWPYRPALPRLSVWSTMPSMVVSCDGLETAMGVLGEARDALAVVHPVQGAGVEVRAVTTTGARICSSPKGDASLW